MEDFIKKMIQQAIFQKNWTLLISIINHLFDFNLFLLESEEVFDALFYSYDQITNLKVKIYLIDHFILSDFKKAICCIEKMKRKDLSSLIRLLSGRSYKTMLKKLNCSKVISRERRNSIVEGILESGDAKRIYKAALKNLKNRRFEDALIQTNNPKYIYFFALNMKSANIEKLEQAICDAKDAIYICLFAQNIPNANMGKLMEAVVATKDPWGIFSFAQLKNVPNLDALTDAICACQNPIYIYYFALDIKDANLEKLTDAMLSTNNEEYIVKFCHIVGVSIPKVVNACPQYANQIIYSVVHSHNLVQIISLLRYFPDQAMEIVNELLQSRSFFCAIKCVCYCPELFSIEEKRFILLQMPSLFAQKILMTECQQVQDLILKDENVFSVFIKQEEQLFVEKNFLEMSIFLFQLYRKNHFTLLELFRCITSYPCFIGYVLNAIVADMNPQNLFLLLPFLVGDLEIYIPYVVALTYQKEKIPDFIDFNYLEKAYPLDENQLQKLRRQLNPLQHLN